LRTIRPPGAGLEIGHLLAEPLGFPLRALAKRVELRGELLRLGARLLRLGVCHLPLRLHAFGLDAQRCGIVDHARRGLLGDAAALHLAGELGPEPFATDLRTISDRPARPADN
jgi:hypothetical protein